VPGQEEERAGNDIAHAQGDNNSNIGVPAGWHCGAIFISLCHQRVVCFAAGLSDPVCGGACAPIRRACEATLASALFKVWLEPRRSRKKPWAQRPFRSVCMFTGVDHSAPRPRASAVFFDGLSASVRAIETFLPGETGPGALAGADPDAACRFINHGHVSRTSTAMLVIVDAVIAPVE